jgi:hypothetical protein
VGGWVFGDRLRPYVQLSSPDRQKGERVGGFQEWVDGGMGGFKEWVDGWMAGWVGLQNLITDLDMRNGHKEGV